MHIRGNCYDLTFNETKEKTVKRKIPDNFTFFLNILASTQVANDKFKHIIEPEDKNREFKNAIIIPEDKIPTIREFLLNLSLTTKFGDSYERLLFENDLLYLEEVNNKYYIGSSKSVLNRLSWHKSHLKSKTHHNEHLQKAYNKYGGNSFTFELLIDPYYLDSSLYH
jgi:hypothetical protein